MGKLSYSSGARAGREGRDPNPPSYNPIMDPLFAVSEKTVERMAEDYERGYQTGTQQRLADEIRNGRDK